MLAAVLSQLAMAAEVPGLAAITSTVAQTSGTILEASALSTTSSQPSDALHLPRTPWEGLKDAAPGSTMAEPTLNLSGNQTTTMRYQHYSALSPAASGLFQSGFTRHETTHLKAAGQVLDTVKIEGEMDQNDVDLDNRYSLKLATKHYEAFLGEFPASFEGSEFTLFQRSLQGVRLKGEVPFQGDALSPGVDFTAIGSAPRGQAAYEKFFGNDTQGPFQLLHAPVVLESERVLVDKVPLVRHVDYELNTLTGLLMFTKRIVERRSLIEVSYEGRQTLYPRTLYGGQINLKSNGADTIGLIGVDERDRKDAGTFAASGTPATAHSVVGATLKHDGEFFRIGGEAAQSFYDPNEFAPGLFHGGAYRGEAEVERFGVKLGGDVKRTEPRFQSMGNTALGSDFLGWSGHGGYKLGRWLTLDGQHRQQRTILNGEGDHQKSTDAKGVVSPAAWPKASYRFYQSEDTLAASFDRLDRRHTAELGQTFKHVNLTTGYEHEALQDRLGTAPNQIWNAGRAGLAVTGVAWLTTALNGELREGHQTSSSVYLPSTRFTTAIGSANIGLTPHAGYSLVADNRWQKTTGQVANNTLRTEAKAKPVDQVNLQGSVSESTLQMPYVGVSRDARNDTAAGLVEVAPVKSASFTYQPTLAQTRLTGVGLPANANRKDGYTAKWAAGSFISTEAGFTREQFRLRDTSQAVLPIQSRQDTDAWNGGLKLAPVKSLSVDFGYTDRTGLRTQANLPSPGGFDQKTTREQTAKVGVKPQLESKLGIDAAYQFASYRQGGNQGPAAALPGYTISPVAQQVQAYTLQNDYTTVHTWAHTANGGLSYQWVTWLLSSATAAYDLRQDRTHRISDVETFAGGGGLTFRVRAVKLEGSYRYAQSHGGARTKQQAVSGSLDVVPAAQVHWTTRAEISLASAPASQATDVTTSLEVSF